MNNKRKLYAFILVLSIMLLNVGVIAYASSTDSSEVYVSQNEIVARLERLYDENNITFEYVDFKEGARYTESEVAKELKQLEESLISYNPVVYGEVVAPTDYSPEWTYNRTYTTYANVSNGISGNATIELKCDSVIDDGTLSFVSISNVRTRQYGNATNFVS